jgi:hypothetical protein
MRFAVWNSSFQIALIENQSAAENLMPILVISHRQIAPEMP